MLTWPKKQLHQFKWLSDDNLIGDLPLEWNWLAGEYEYKKDVKNIHYTEGGLGSTNTEIVIIQKNG